VPCTLLIRLPPGEVRSGRLITPLVIRGFVEPDREIHCDALVDTGAYCLTLPTAWKERLGPLPVSRPVKLETADHRTVDGEIAGPVTIQIEGFDAIVGEVLFMTMEPGQRRFEPLLGYITLEQAGIAVDMVGHRLIRVPHFDLKAARAA